MAIQTFTAAQVLTAAQMNALQANDYNQTVSAKVASYTLIAADKGTRITMSNAAATTITVNTSLFAAGDSLRIQNLNGGGVCTITAGTATVTSAGPLTIPSWGGGQLYFTSASAAVWFPDAASTVTDWAAWTPTWTNLTVGNATQTARYSQAGKTVFFTLKLVLGSTSSVGAQPTFTWPVTAASATAAENAVTKVLFLDAGAQIVLGATDPRSSTTALTKLNAPSGTVQLQDQDRAVSSTVPFTWTTSDTIWVMGSYEGA